MFGDYTTLGTAGVGHGYWVHICFTRLGCAHAPYRVRAHPGAPRGPSTRTAPPLSLRRLRLPPLPAFGGTVPGPMAQGGRIGGKV